MRGELCIDASAALISSVADGAVVVCVVGAGADLQPGTTGRLPFPGGVALQGRLLLRVFWGWLLEQQQWQMRYQQLATPRALVLLEVGGVFPFSVSNLC